MVLSNDRDAKELFLIVALLSKLMGGELNIIANITDFLLNYN